MSGRLAVVRRSPEAPEDELARRLDAVARRIAASGSASERPALHAVAEATRWLAPGAAAALVDWTGPEVARLRAYGLLHGVALHALDDDDQAWLVGRLGGTPSAELDDRVA